MNVLDTKDETKKKFSKPETSLSSLQRWLLKNINESEQDAKQGMNVESQEFMEILLAWI